MGTLRHYWALFKHYWFRTICAVFGHTTANGSVGAIGVRGCMRCQIITEQKTIRRPFSRGDVERRVMASLPAGYTFLGINWKKRTLQVLDENGNKRITRFDNAEESVRRAIAA